MPRAQPARFSRGLCGCFADVPLACAVCVCQPTANGQMYERATAQPRSCAYIASVLWGVWFLTSLLASVGSAYVDNAIVVDDDGVRVADSNLRTGSVVLAISSAVSGVGTLVSTAVLCAARKRIRDRHRIVTGECGNCEDCCVAYWCGCCLVAQLFAHEGVTSDDYSVLSATGV